MFLHPGKIFRIAPVIGMRFNRHFDQFKYIRAFAFPRLGINPNMMTSGGNCLSNTHKIALQTAKGKIFI